MIRFGKYPGSEGLHPCHHEIFKGVIVYPGVAIVHVSDQAVAETADSGAGGPVSIAKAHPKDEIQYPDGFLQKPPVELRLFLPDPAGHLQKRVHHLGALQGLLAHVAGIMPAAAVGKLHAVMDGQDVAVAGSVSPSHRIAAALAVQKVKHLPDRLIEGMGADRKGRALDAPRSQEIRSLPVKTGEIPQIKGSLLVCHRAGNSGIDRHFAFRVTELKRPGFCGGNGALWPV